MRLAFSTYWPLLLALIAIPWLLWVQGRTLSDLSPKHLKLSTAIRCFIVLLLALALMQPTLYRSGAWFSVVYLLDVSQSVAPAAIQSAMQWIEEANATGFADNSQFIPFAENSVQFDTLDELRNVQVTNQTVNGSINQSGTDIENALNKALGSFAPHHLKRLVLLTDGNENAGRMLDQIGRLKQDGVRVHTVPLAARANGDAWVETVMAPTHVSSEETFPIEVHVYSQVDADGEVEVRQGDETIGTRPVHLTRGINRIAFESRITEETGPVTVEAEVRSGNDPFPDNNRFRESLVVEGKPRILYVEGRLESAQYLKAALELEGFEVDVVAPLAMPYTVEALDTYDAIVLSDVARSSLTNNHMQSIATYVRELGGGFILSGGENNYGEGGYSETLIEEVLPVKFELKKEPDSVAMIIVFDKSGSMGGQKLELSKVAAKAPLDLLKDTDLFGLVAFDYNYYWPVRLQPVSNRSTITQEIDKILAGGETNAYPAMGEAFIELTGAETQVKHMIVLSDGRSLRDDFEGLTKKMAEAKITVSGVAVGEGADRELIENIALWGKGRSYYLADPRRVPQIFIEETKLATGKTLHEDPFKPAVKKTVEVFKGIDFNTAPELLGYVATTSKDTSEVLLNTEYLEEEYPILARWQYGLGKSAAFTSDLKDRWAVNWLKWNGYGKFWSQLVRETMRRRDDDSLDLRVERVDDEARITINALEKDGRFRNKMQSELKVVAPNQTTSDANVQQAGPGYYEATVPLKQDGSYLFRAVGPDGAGPSRLLPYSYPEEYHFYPPDTDMLRAISSGTGGKFQPTVQDVFNVDGESTSVPTPLWPGLMVAALLFYVADVFLRRVRLFES